MIMIKWLFNLGDIYLTDPNAVNENIIEELQIFPNPAVDVVNVLKYRELASIRIYSIIGSLVYESNDVSSSIDISQLQAGSYLIRADGMNGKTYMTKFIVN